MVNGLELAEERGVGTGDGSGSDEGPANCARLHDGPSDGMFAQDGAEQIEGLGGGTGDGTGDGAGLEEGLGIWTGDGPRARGCAICQVMACPRRMAWGCTRDRASGRATGSTTAWGWLRDRASGVVREEVGRQVTRYTHMLLASSS